MNMDPGRLELSMDSIEYGKGLYMPSFQHDRLTSPDASGLTFSPQAPTPQQMFGGHGLKVTITEEEINKKFSDMKNNIRLNERKPNAELDDNNRTQYLAPSPRSAFQSYRS